MDLRARTLVIPAKPDVERDAVAEAFARRGGSVVRLDRFWEVSPVDGAVLYGPDTFVLVVAERLGLSLRSPDDALVVRVPAEDLGRAVAAISLGDALRGAFPCFVKPLVPKQFRAGVWDDRCALAAETRGLAEAEVVLRAEVVRFVCEVRAFVLDGEVRTASCYEGDGDADDAARWMAPRASRWGLPRACAADVGWIDGRGWAVIEANAAWGAGLNGCDAERAVDVIVAATDG